MDISARFTASVLYKMRQDIEEADGNEVFWAGKVNTEGLVSSVRVGSRGTEDSVIVNHSVARGSDVLIHNHPSGNVHPSEADQAVAFTATDTSLGFYIVDNELSKVYVVVEPVKPKSITPLDLEESAFYLSKEGPLAQKNQLYEERPSQIQLLSCIAEAFNKNSIGVFEAGTGVGKSYAYLIPALLWAKRNNERVVISTGTINLQQQLVEKDIPAVQEILGARVKAVLVKGRQNYVCLRRLNDAETERSLFDEDAELFQGIVSWTKTTSSGSKSDLATVPPESLWSRVNSESDACMGMRCPFREQCFVMKVRKEALDSLIIVVNHHLLFADIESRMNGAGYEDAAVLPPYSRLIFDEAHGIEDSATSFFSESLTKFKVQKQIGLLYRGYRAGAAGFLVQLSVYVKDEDFLAKAVSLVQEIKDSAQNADDIALSVLDEESTLRIFDTTVERFSGVFFALNRLGLGIGNLTKLVREAVEALSEEDKELPCVFETKTVLRRLDEYTLLCKSFCQWNETEDTVFWLQKIRMAPRKAGESATLFVQFSKTPLDIAPLMNAGVFEPMKTVVCVSATLRIGTSFSYYMRRTGLSYVVQERLLKGVFDSPFPYKTAALFAVPKDAPLPDSPLFQGFVEEAVPALIFAAQGRTLVLFTSYESLRRTYSATFTALHSGGIDVYKQGDDDRFRLLEHFKENKSSVLFATNSFWEGVDVPGESLSQVIIVKLPFAVPNDPVFEARAEAVEKRGGFPFMELSVPQAVIQFKQGFGRLIRRGDDKGVIVVLDKRIVEKSYGKQFTTSVPMTRRMNNPLKEIVTATRQFLG